MTRFSGNLSPSNTTWRVILAAALWAAAAFAQIDTGSIVGTVRDSSGATIPKASLTATNKATNLTLTTTTNEAGQYQFNALLPGTYVVRASAPGFSAQEVSDVEIH